MEAVELIGQPVSKGPILIHEHASSFIFLGWLKEKQEIVLRLYLDQLLQQAQG